jgi:predicted N-acetyltransferase YhbS
MITARPLLREEITQVWNIDRSEFIENIYRLQRGQLVLQPHNFEVPGWPPGEAEKYTPILLDCFDRGGWLHGAFDDGRLIAVAVLESRFIGSRRDKLQLVFFHVSRPYRNQGLGARLFRLAKAAARERGAARMYISATRSEHTVNFYMRLGCVVTEEPDPDLLALEPVDIHLELEI